MKIELKRFTTNARLSQETTAFAADVWVDGKHVGHARNDGRGGATLVHLDPSVRAQVEAFGAALVPAEYKTFTGGVEWLVDQLVDAELQKKSDKVFAKRLAKIDAKQRAANSARGLGTARYRDGGEWSWFGFKNGADPADAAKLIAAKHNGKVDVVVVVP